MDLTNKSALIVYLKAQGLGTQKKLGQNFLVNKDVLTKIIQAAELVNNDTVLEVGPGVGTLTWGLSPKIKDGLLLAVEKDYQLVELLRREFKNARHVKIIHDDIRRFDLCSIEGEYKVVANVPYYLTSILIRKLLEGKCVQTIANGRWTMDAKVNKKSHSPSAIVHQPDLIVLTIQKEVAERITAQPGDSNRGILTVMVELMAEAEIIADVPRSNFYPEPSVDSAIIRLKPKIADRRWTMDDSSKFKSHRLSSIDYRLIMQVVKAGFSAKRRQLHNSLAGGLGLSSNIIRDILKQARINGQKRAEDLTIKQWQELTSAWYRAATKG